VWGYVDEPVKGSHCSHGLMVGLCSSRARGDSVGKDLQIFAIF